MNSKKWKVNLYRSGKLLHTVEAGGGETLLRCITAAGAGIDAPCGGQGKCGKCIVRLGVATTGEGISVFNSILACRTAVNGDMDVFLPDERVMDILSGVVIGNDEAGDTKAPGTITVPSIKPRLGVAVDIGTTTVALHLIDIDSGMRLATASAVNAQRSYGADVISRIKYCAEKGVETLTRLIREQLSTLIKCACEASGASVEHIAYISIAANTVMEHIFAGYSPVSLGIAPFTPVNLFGVELKRHDLPDMEQFSSSMAGINGDATLYLAPAISAYVGGDITAGLLAAGHDDMPEPAVFIDIGTNGEIALKHDGRYYCCASAAGPAFEGAEISYGMAAVNGAISHVKWDGGLQIETIGDAPPEGICGSGLLDALAVLLDAGAVDETGRLLGAEEVRHDIARYIDRVDGKNVLYLTDKTDNEKSVYISAMDIRKLQLAKAAIAAGILTLLIRAGITEGQVRAFILAGGFGSYLDRFSAARIGLFPTSFLQVIRTPGNTAGEGAALALRSQASREALQDIGKRSEYIELSSNPVFGELFISNMSLCRI